MGDKGSHFLTESSFTSPKICVCHESYVYVDPSPYFRLSLASRTAGNSVNCLVIDVMTLGIENITTFL
jgi:hypothetical protein